MAVCLVVFGVSATAEARTKAARTDPYASDSYSANLETLLSGVWPNAYSTNEAGIGPAVGPSIVKSGLRRVRSRGGTIPPLTALGAVGLPNTDTPWTLRWKMLRYRPGPFYIDTKWTQLESSSLGKYNATTSFLDPGWRVQTGCVTTGGDGTTTKAFPIGCDPNGSTKYWVYYGFTPNYVRVDVWRTGCGGSTSCGGFYDAMAAGQDDTQPGQVPLGQVVEVKGTDDQPCNRTTRGNYPGNLVHCYFRYATTDQMEFAVATDRFESFINQPVDVWTAQNQFLYAYNAAEARTEIADPREWATRNWINTQLDSSFIAPTMLEHFAPNLRYDALESFRADAANEITDNYVSGLFSNELQGSGGVPLADSDPSLASDDLSLGCLGATYTCGPIYGGQPAFSSDKIDEHDDYVSDFGRLHESPAYQHKTYGRAVETSAGTVLQYWFFYYDNPKTYLGYGAHEGDWEMIQILLKRDLTLPVEATYSQHDSPERCDWTHVQRTADLRPIVYVAEGSHANYYGPGYHWQADDTSNGDGDSVTPTVIDVTLGPAWLNWPGKWGGSDSSPDGPARHSSWTDPLAYASGAGGCSVGQTYAYGNGRRLAKVPPLPAITARRIGTRVTVTYRFRSWPEGSARPRMLLVGVDTRSNPPYTTRTMIRRRAGRVVQPVGRGSPPYRLLVSVVGQGGRRSRTLVRALP